MSQLDWVGAPPDTPARVIRNTRPSSAEEKACLVLELGELINTIPVCVKAGGTIDSVRDWKKTREAAAKVAGNSRASSQELTAAIKNMRRYFA